MFRVSSRLAVVVLGCLCTLLAPCCGYVVGEYVPMARKGQYKSLRTHWHDVIGRQCPRFGISNEVAVSIPKPIGYTPGNPYKLSLMVGKERFTTPWLLVLGRREQEMPVVEVALTHQAGAIRGVHAKVVMLPAQYMEEHQEIYKQFADPDLWPKHILVKYTWKEVSEVDAPLAIVVLFGSVLLLTTVVGAYIFQSSKDKFMRFLKETLEETSTMVAPMEPGKGD